MIPEIPNSVMGNVIRDVFLPKKSGESLDESHGILISTEVFDLRFAILGLTGSSYYCHRLAGPLWAGGLND